MSSGKNKNIALCLPAILDLNLIKKTTATIKNNIIDANPDFNFNIFVNVDNYRRSDGVGTAEEVSQCYRNLVSDHCHVDITCQKERVGMNFSYIHLYKKFINSNSEHCLYFDDDHEIINPIRFKEFYHLLDDKNIYHLAAAKKEVDKEFSYENPFLENVVLHDLETIKIYKNNRNFHTLPGTIFSKNQAKIILFQLEINKTHVMIEDMVARTAFFQTCEIYTVFFKDGDMKYSKNENNEGWILPLKNHFAYDRIRAFSGFSGAGLKDYN